MPRSCCKSPIIIRFNFRVSCTWPTAPKRASQYLPLGIRKNPNLLRSHTNAIQTYIQRVVTPPTISATASVVTKAIKFGVIPVFFSSKRRFHHSSEAAGAVEILVSLVTQL